MKIMSGIPMNDQSQAEAARWFARLQTPDCAPAERLAFEHWSAAHPDHAAAYAHVERLMGRVVELRDDPAILLAAQEALRGGSMRRSAWPRMAGLALAAGLVLAAGLAVLHFSQTPVPAMHYATATGEQRSVQLADGSMLQLDTDTQLDVHYAAGERRVDLLRGRAQYKVAHDIGRPFVVRTLGGTVTAIGTEFQTSLQDNAVVVTLLNGKVSVVDHAGAGAHSALLLPGEQITYNTSGTIWNKAKANVEAANSWTQGRLVFKDEPLRHLVKEVNRYSSVKLRIADPSIDNLRISGTFKADDQESLLLALHGIWSIDANAQPNGEILLSRQH